MKGEREAYLALSELPARKANRLLEEAGSARAAARKAGCQPPPDLAEPYLARCDPEYPRSLLQLADPPSVLYYSGRLPGPQTLCVAVVGTRDASAYGLSFASRLGRDLAAAGITVVSGLARGIDAAAHRGSLQGDGELPTIAVLGCGLDVNYPSEHRRLQQEIASRGLLLSEYRPGTGPEKWRFPARNRLVAALSAAVVVVEAPARSGALITVNEALDLGREVLVVPGPVGWRQSQGTLELLREGATLIRNAQDVLEAVGLDPTLPPAPPRDPVLEAISATGSSADELQANTGLSMGELLVRLTRLEVQRLILRAGEGRWVRL